jgi:hypothetical protein
MEKPWTEKDDNRLLKMKSFRTPTAVIAKDLGRTEAAIKSRYKLLKPRSRTLQARQVAQQYLDDQRALMQMLQSKLN